MFENLTSEDILAAINDLVDRGDLRKTQYRIWYKGYLLSPPSVISRAYELKNSPIDRNSFNTDNAQKRLLELGFPIIDTEMPDDFFSKKDLITFGKLVNRPSYNSKDPIDENIGQFLKDVIWDKTIQWALKLKELGWDVEGQKNWNERGSRFKKYTWYRIYPKDRKNDLLTFTIGIDTEEVLIYKLDLKKASRFYTPSLEKRFQTLCKNLNIKWQYIKSEELKEKNWDKLISESNKFFESHLNNFDAISNDLFPGNDRRLMRLTWNTNNWEFPCVHNWKKKNQGNGNIAHENQYGYGHEEWLFNPRYRLDGFQYGYIRGIDYLSEKEEFLDEIILYTISESKKRLLVGRLKNVEIIEGWDEEIKKLQPLYDTYKKNMISELKDVNADYKYFKSYGLFPNAKFNWADVTIYNEPIPCSFLEGPEFNRFRPYKIDADLEELLNQEVAIENRLDFKSGKASTTVEYDKQTEGGKSTVKRSHSNITDDLYDYLHEIIGHDLEQLSAEKTKVGGAIVDLVINEPDGYSLFEAKTSGVGLKNIRNAIGQLLEYAFLDHTVKIKKLIIIGPTTLKRHEKEYLNKIKSILKVPLDYWAYQLEEKELRKKFVRQ